jgi:hypothetical protein
VVEEGKNHAKPMNCCAVLDACLSLISISMKIPALTKVFVSSVSTLMTNFQTVLITDFITLPVLIVQLLIELVEQVNRMLMLVLMLMLMLMLKITQLAVLLVYNVFSFQHLLLFLRSSTPFLINKEIDDKNIDATLYI